MGRRKLIFYGQQLDEIFEVALGAGNWDEAREIVNASGFEVPKVAWAPIENHLGFELEKYSKDKISIHFETMFRWSMANSVNRSLTGRPKEADEISENEFLKKVGRIEKLAKELVAEIDALGEVGNALLMRPNSKDGLTSLETPDEFYSKVSGECEPVSESDFFEYYSFRKMLDYYAHFEKMNAGFSSIHGHRFDRMPDYSQYETFIRRVLLAVFPTNFPLEITIPTDTNPDYESKIVLLCSDLREQINRIAEETPGCSNFFEVWSYRRHARLLLKLREEFNQSEIFWPLVALRHWDKK